MDAANNNAIIAASFDKTTLPQAYSYIIREISDTQCTQILNNTTKQLPVTASQQPETIEISPYMTAYCSTHLDVSYWKWFSDNMLSSSSLRDRHVFVWDWRWPIGSNNISTSFPVDAFDRYRAAHADKRICVIINTLTDPPDYNSNFHQLCTLLVAQGIQPKDILLWGSVDDTTNSLITIVNTKYGYMDGHDHMRLDYNSLKHTTHHFIMLARRPRPLRLMIADRILTMGLLKYGHVSCGCNSYDSYEYDTTPFVSDSNRHRFPLVLDDHIPNKNPKMYQLTDSRILNAAINIICETSQDQGLDLRSFWHLPFATEKSTKAFVLHQFPLMVGVTGMVECLRRDGFDMFDDLIDHSYDTEPDPAVRITMVISQLTRLVQLSDIAAVRTANWTRLQYNHDRVKHIINSYPSRCRELIDNWLTQTDHAV
jgi:hypothetical protein